MQDFYPIAISRISTNLHHQLYNNTRAGTGQKGQWIVIIFLDSQLEFSRPARHAQPAAIHQSKTQKLATIW